MTMLVWDQVEERRFETGIDRGVLYPAEDYGVVWNGLVSVSEAQQRETKVYHQDGVKVLERMLPKPYSAKLQAFTYPDELDKMIGNEEVLSGVSLHDQHPGGLTNPAAGAAFPGKFDLSYRTRIGNAAEGADFAYTLHLLYNLMINPEDVDMSSISDTPEAATFGWTVSSTPVPWGAKLISHISLDSRLTDPALLADVERVLYGSETNEAYMPAPVQLLESQDLLTFRF